MDSPSPENYVLGKGVVYFNQYDFDNSVYFGERDLGNAPEFTFTVSIDKLEHFSSRGGIKAKDKEVITQLTPSLSFTLDEVNADNLALLTLGEITEVTQASGSATAEVVTAIALGRYASLEFRAVTNVIVKDDTDTTTYVEGTDYAHSTLLKDDKLGRIKILEGGSITAGDELHIDYDYAELTYKQIQAFKHTQIEGELRFVSDNPVGTQQEMMIWRVSLTSDGDTALIGDDWSTLGFTGEILKDESGHPNSPYFNINML